MAETSFPVVDMPLSADEWQTMARAWGDGVIDRGGWPYLIQRPMDSVNDTVTILVSQNPDLPRNEAILSGFVHRIDTAKTLSLPPVSVDTTYEIGLVYDPLKHSATGGPVTLDVWTTPADYEGQKNRLVLYQVDRKPNITLENSTVREYRQRISTQVAVSNDTDLPNAETMLVDTVALVRNSGRSFRLNIEADGTRRWIEIGSPMPNPSVAPTADTLAQRTGSGSVRGTTPIHADDLVPRQWFLDQTELLRTASGGNVADVLVKRGSDAGFLVPTATHASHPVPLTQADGRYFRPASEYLDAARLSKTGGVVPWEVVDGSTPGYNRTSSAGASVFFNGNGRFYRYTSALKYKTNVRPWNPDPRELLKVGVYVYDRVDPDTGEVTPANEVGTIADWAEPHLPDFVEYGPDKAGGDDVSIQGWAYYRWTNAHQKLIQWLTERVDAQDERIAEQAGHIDELSEAMSALLERIEKLEG